MTTKEQERKALEQIRKIVESLGEQSYIGTAFEGCFEKAEENIEYDVTWSWKAAAELAEKTVQHMKQENCDLRMEMEKVKEVAFKEITALQLRIEESESRCLSADDLHDCIQLAKERFAEAQEAMDEAAKRIVYFAENPDSAEFRAAVGENRRMAKTKEYYLALCERLESKE